MTDIKEARGNAGEVKRWTLWTVSESGCELEPYSEESPDGTYIKASDYDQLKAENEQQAARIALYERALLVSWPEGAKGEVYDLWNEARTMGSKGDGN